MVNRAETLSNLGGLPDVTAWRGIRNAYRTNVADRSLPEEPKLISKITELNQELRFLKALSTNPNLSPQQRSQCNLLQQQRRSELHEEMTRARTQTNKNKQKMNF